MKRTANQRQPLRKIIRTKADRGSIIEVLECGHEQLQKSDMIGPTNAYRRRCRGCVLAEPEEPKR